jgi:alanine racemase
VRRAEALVSLGAIERNCSRLLDALTGNARLCAVVKADGYGHGAVPVAQAALRAGAEMLAVAASSEADELRGALPDAPIFTMGALTPAELDEALEAGSEVAVWREGFRWLLAGRASAYGLRPRVHVKYDTGMGRLGERDPEAVLALCDAVASDPRLELAGLWTHLATADESDESFMREQLAKFQQVADVARERHPGVILHAANSAATLRNPASHLDMVRCGIAVYGLDPFGRDPEEQGLEAALELRSYVADVKRFDPGDSAGYGRQWRAERETWVGVIPIGYGDGVRRALTNNAHVLIEGVRRPLVGTVSMDNITVDLGPESDVEPGAEAVLIGVRGSERILAEDMAAALGTINYEITTTITHRVPRGYLGGGV